MGLFAVFLLGIANFALHGVALSRGRMLMARLTPEARGMIGLLSLIFELGVLIASMAMVVGGEIGWLWGYALYTAGNAVGAWFMVRGRL